MLKHLLIDENKVPTLFEYEPMTVGSKQVRVKSLYGAPKHGTEMNMHYHGTTFATHDYDKDLYMFGQCVLYYITVLSLILPLAFHKQFYPKY